MTHENIFPGHLEKFYVRSTHAQRDFDLQQDARSQENITYVTRRYVDVRLTTLAYKACIEI